MKKEIKLHKSIRKRLKIPKSLSDSEYLKQWKEKASEVCKPCWELKYCPYGPIVEDFPLLPPIKQMIIESNEYTKECLSTGLYGIRNEISEDRKRLLKDILELSETNFLKFIQIIAVDFYPGLRYPDLVEDDPFKRILKAICKPESKEKIDNKEITLVDIEPKIIEFANEKKIFIKNSLDSGFEDNRKPLESWRREMFEKDIANTNIDDYPDSIPKILQESSCKIFGHICPAFFVAESFTESRSKRSKRRSIPTHIKLRIARRDNYSCQICGKHLLDSEIEFDHIIPLSKGGSSNENNIQTLCFECNRSKSNKIKTIE